MKNYRNYSFPLPIKIIGIGRYLPKKIIYSDELEEKYGLDKGWCERKQGVKERRWAEGDETESYMGAQAVLEALDDAKLLPEDIDLLINAAQTFEQAVPDGGALILKQLGLGNKGIPTYTVTSACLSFLAGFDIAANVIVTGKFKNIVIVTSEIITSLMNFEDKNVFTMFGDCAAAVVISKTPENETSALNAVRMETYSNHFKVSSLSGGESYKSMFNKKIRPNDFQFHFDAAGMQSVSMKYNKKFFQKLWPNVNQESFQAVIPNQASRLAVDYLKLMFPAKKIISIIDHIGNSGAVGYPMALYEAIKDKELKRNDRLLLFGMGAGFSIYGMVITY